MKRNILIFILSGLFYLGYAQVNAEDSAAIARYLYGQLEYKQERISCQMLDSISSAELFCSKMSFSLGDGSSIPTTYELIKTDAGFKPVFSSQELICSAEFIASIDKKFSLIDKNSAFRFQEILDIVDDGNNLNSDRSFFKKDNTWYFVRDEFFDEYEFFVVETSNKGKILSISFQKAKIEIPEDITKSNRHRADWGYKPPGVSQDDSAHLRTYLDEQTNFHWEFTPIKSRLVEKITKAEFYNTKIVFTTENFSNAMGFNVMKFQDSITHANSSRELLEKPLFNESLIKDFTLKSEADALTIEEALDVIVPVSSFDVEDKEHLFNDGKWFFVRSESFGDKAAFIAETDAEGKIIAFTYEYKAINNQ